MRYLILIILLWPVALTLSQDDGLEPTFPDVRYGEDYKHKDRLSLPIPTEKDTLPAIKNPGLSHDFRPGFCEKI